MYESQARKCGFRPMRDLRSDHCSFFFLFALLGCLYSRLIIELTCLISLTQFTLVKMFQLLVFLFTT